MVVVCVSHDTHAPAWFASSCGGRNRTYASWFKARHHYQQRLPRIVSQRDGRDSNPRHRITGAASSPLDDQCSVHQWDQRDLNPGHRRAAVVMRRRGFKSLPVLLFIDNSAHQDAPMRAPTVGWSAAACRLAMAKVRVQLPLGALDEQDVGKPGIPRASGARERGFKSRRPDCLIRCTRVGSRDRPVKPTWHSAPPLVRVQPPEPCCGRSSQSAMAAASKAAKR